MQGHAHTHTLQVSGQMVTFLVESRAAESVIRTSDLTPTPKMSGRSLRTIGATGNSVTEKYTVPLKSMMK